MPNPKILWIALLQSVLVYLAIAFIVVPVGEVTLAEAISNSTVRMFYMIAAASFVMAFVAPSLILRSGTNADGSLARPAARSIFNALIVRWALLEATSIIGLIAAFVTSSREVFFPPFVAAVVGFLLSFPSASYIEKLESH